MISKDKSLILKRLYDEYKGIEYANFSPQDVDYLLKIVKNEELRRKEISE